MARKIVFILLVFNAILHIENRFVNSLPSEMPQSEKPEVNRIEKSDETPKVDEENKDKKGVEKPNYDMDERKKYEKRVEDKDKNVDKNKDHISNEENFLTFSDENKAPSATDKMDPTHFSPKWGGKFDKYIKDPYHKYYNVDYKGWMPDYKKPPFHKKWWDYDYEKGYGGSSLDFKKKGYYKKPPLHKKWWDNPYSLDTSSGKVSKGLPFDPKKKRPGKGPKSMNFYDKYKGPCKPGDWICEKKFKHKYSFGDVYDHKFHPGKYDYDWKGKYDHKFHPGKYDYDWKGYGHKFHPDKFDFDWKGKYDHKFHPGKYDYDYY